MKRALLSVAILFAASTILQAQKSPVEVDFEKNRVRYARENFAEGEDASSGFDYVYFRSGKDIVMIRSIWSASYTRELRIEDMYFDRDGLALFRRSTARKNMLASLKTGRTTPPSVREEMVFEKRKLKHWTQDGREVNKDAASWSDTERSTLETAKSWIDSYADLKNGNQ